MMCQRASRRSLIMDIVQFTFVMGSATGGAAFVMGLSWWG